MYYLLMFVLLEKKERNFSCKTFLSPLLFFLFLSSLCSFYTILTDLPQYNYVLIYQFLSIYYYYYYYFIIIIIIVVVVVVVVVVVIVIIEYACIYLFIYFNLR